MSYKELTPEEAASLIKHGHHIGLERVYSRRDGQGCDG